MNKNKTFILAITMLSVGTILLFSSSYSLITGNVTEESYGFNVASFDVEFLDKTKISLNGVPTSDEEGMKTSKEFTFTVNNTSNNDVNYRLDIIENSVYKMDDVIKYAYSVNDGAYSDIYLLSKNYTLNQNRVLQKGAKDTYKIKLWLSLDADERYMNKKFSAMISLSATQNEYKYATSVIERLGSNNLDGVVKVNNDYRYSKMNQNYLWFNCQDNHTKGSDYCEKWHIIGSFDNTWENGVATYKSLKIIRDEVYDKASFSNEEYQGDFNKSYIETFLNGSFYDKLNNEAKKMILKAKWNIGSTKGESFNSSLYQEGLKTYYGNIGLMNVSDYLYLQKDFMLKNILLLNKDEDKVNVIGESLDKKNSLDIFNILPCLYLKPDVSIISGDGSENSPYELGVKFPMTYGVTR